MLSLATKIICFDDYDKVKSCLNSPLRDLYQYAGILKEFQGCNKHMDRHQNEIIYVKCKDPSCCTAFR